MADLVQTDTLLQRGIAAAKAGRKQEARQALLRAVELDEQNEQAWLWLSGIVESLRDKRVCLMNVLAINPNNAHARAGLHWLEQHARASSATPQGYCPHCAAAIPPLGTTCPHCRRPLIVVCPACEEYVDVDQTSCSDCGQLLGDFREGAHYHLALARAYLDQRKLELAQQAAVRAEAESSGNPQMMGNVAAVHEATGHPDLAIAAYARAIEGDPNNTDLYVRLGTIHLQHSRFAEARTMYQKAAQLSGQDPTVLYGLARIHIEENGATPKALKLLHQVIKLKPEHAQAHLRLGDAYFEQKRLKQAHEHYEHACQLTSSDSMIGQQAHNKLIRLELLLHPQDRTRETSSGRAIKSRQRPGCVTAYAALNALASIALGFVAASSNLIQGEISDSLAIGTFTAAAFGLVIAAGLWNLKNWARIVVIVSVAAALPGFLFQAIQGIDEMTRLLSLSGFRGLPALFAILGVCVWIALAAFECYIVFWFVLNGDLFD